MNPSRNGQCCGHWATVRPCRAGQVSGSYLEADSQVDVPLGSRVPLNDRAVKGRGRTRVALGLQPCRVRPACRQHGVACCSRGAVRGAGGHWCPSRAGGCTHLCGPQTPGLLACMCWVRACACPHAGGLLLLSPLPPLGARLGACAQPAHLTACWRPAGAHSRRRLCGSSRGTRRGRWRGLPRRSPLHAHASVVYVRRLGMQGAGDVCQAAART